MRRNLFNDRYDAPTGTTYFTAEDLSSKPQITLPKNECAKVEPKDEVEIEELNVEPLATHLKVG